MRPMRERNQITVAIVGTVIAAALVLLAMNLGKVPFLHPSRTYHAQFANGIGIKSGDDVRVEGISVGKVKSVKVKGDRVDVAFTVKSDLKLGANSEATIEVATVLGNLFMQVESAGPGTLESGATIPLERTTVPYTLIGALNQFGQFSNQTDLPKLQESLKTLAQTISGISPKAADQTLKGLAKMSMALASKQKQVADILAATNTITETLNDNSASLVAMLSQGDEFLRLLRTRHDVIASLLRDTAKLGQQLSVLIDRNGAQLTPLLANLKSVTDVLAKEKTQLRKAVEMLGAFGTNITNATGAGPWLDLLAPLVAIPDNQIKACGPHPVGKKPCG